MIILRDDRFFSYAGVPTRLDVLQNDTLTGPVTLTGTSSATNFRNLGDAFEITLTTILGSVGNEGVSYSVSGTTATAFASLIGLDGTPGLGGFFFSENDQSEDGGTYQINVDQMIDPAGNGGYSITSFTLDSQFLGGVTAFLNNGVISLDLDHFSKLTAGQSELVTIQIGTSDGSQTASSTISFYVSGADDVVTSITTAKANGDMDGTSGNDLISSIANQENSMFGGRGADIFQFKSDHSDGNSDKNTIIDYQIGRDSIEFAAGTVIEYMFEMDNGVMLVLDGGQDVLFVHGVDVNLDSLDMIGAAYRSADLRAGDGPLDPATFNLFLHQYGQTNATFSEALGYGFGGIYGVNIDFG